MKPRYEYVIGYFNSFGPRTRFTTCERIARKVGRKVGAPSCIRVGDGQRRYVSLTRARGPDCMKSGRIPQRNATQRRRIVRAYTARIRKIKAWMGL